MKWGIFLFLIPSFAACSPFLHTVPFQFPVHQCAKQVHYRVDTCIPYDKLELIRSAFNYWNLELGKDFFVPANDGMKVSCAPINLEHPAIIAHTILLWELDGCILSSDIFKQYDWSYGDDIFWGTVFRHEIGHVLGLKDSDSGLMFRWMAIQPEFRQMSEYERRAVLKEYR